MGSPAPSAPGPAELAGFAFNDYGNAQRLMRLIGATIEADGSVDLTGATLLYLREVGWIAFNGQFWDLRAGEQLARRTAHQVAQVVRGLWDEVQERMTAAAFWKFADGCGQNGATGAMLKQAECYLTVDFEAFDGDPLALNVENGVLRFRRNADGTVATQFIPGHRAADRFTRMAAVAYEPGAAAPVWAKSMEYWQPVAATRAFLHRLLGYAATGCTHEQLFAIFHGKGRDGKSTMIWALRQLLGSYAATASIETFLDAGPKRGGDANADVARLAGDTRLVSTAEPPAGAKLADNVLKSFTGGAPLLARMLHKGFFEFTPVGKVVMECNLLPRPQGSDDGIWRRLVLVPFRNQLPEGSEDKALPGKLKAEMPGILNWLVEGIEAWLREGLHRPDEVIEAGSSYRKSSSPFGEWVMDRLIMDKDAKVLASDLYADFKAWMADQGHEERQVMTQRAFGSALGDRQIILAGKDGAGRKQRSGARLRRPQDGEASGSAGAGGASAPGPGADVGGDGDWGGS